MSTPNAPRTRPQQFGFLRDAHDGPLVWKALCLSLARQAPGLPAVYPSAKAAMDATPNARRFSLAKARRAMIAYFDDPADTNPFAHIVTIAGWDGCAACFDGSPDDDPSHKHTGDLNDLLVWSNDAKRTGGVDVVRASFFPEHWGDGFKFAADWLNGYDLPGYDADGKPVPAKPSPGRGTLGENYDHAIADVRRAIRRHRAAGHTRVVAALADDLRRMKAKRAKFQ